MIKKSRKRESRLHVKHAFFTYSNVDTSVNIYEFIRHVNQKFVGCRGSMNGKSRVSGFCIGREIHKSNMAHFHVYIRFDKKYMYSYTRPDITICGRLYHGNYQRVRSVNAVLTYCRKDGDYVQHNLTAGLAHTIIKSRDQFDLLMALDRAGKHRQRPFWTRVYQLYRQRAQHKKRLQLTRHIVSFPWFQRYLKPQSLMGWLKAPDRRPKGLMLSGPSETGKTSFIIKLAGQKPYFVATEPRHFCNYAGQSIIALDQFSWRNWQHHIPFLKNLVTGHKVSTPSYYGCKLLATPRVVIICTNENPQSWAMPPELCARFYFFRTDTGQQYRWIINRWVVSYTRPSMTLAHSTD